jgi:hypothetical protein
MDLAILIERLVPAAKYRGSVTANDKAAFDGLIWEDDRSKPTWSEIEAASSDVAKERKLTELAAYRYNRETAGITVNGSQIKTDRESQATITGAFTLAAINPDMEFNWKAVNGFLNINKVQLQAIAVAVGQHVQACFSREKVHAQAISALTTAEEVEAYDFTTGWPV